MSNERPVPLTFVVNSGRCGSTMLSRILQTHPDVLSASEYLNTMRSTMGGTLFPPGAVSGADLWELLRASEPDADAAIRSAPSGLVSKLFGVAYPYETGRFGPGTGIPRICHFVLPMLSDDPDALFDQLAAEVPSWPARPPAVQYRALLGFLTRLLGRQVAVERSGGSVTFPALLFPHYPDARFVHLYRDGPDCSLSLSKFPATRTMVLTAMAAAASGLPPTAPWDTIINAAPAELKDLLTSPRDWDRIMGYPIPLAHFGTMWSEMMREALNSLSQVPGESWISLKYEQLVADPRPQLTRLAEFIGVPAIPAWLDRARGIVTGNRTGTAAAQLDPGTLKVLRAACEPGERAIAAMDAAWRGPR
jgi:hypothetical protein